MKVEKKFMRTKEEFANPEKFNKRIANYIHLTYGCKYNDAIWSIKNALRYDWSICLTDVSSVGIQTNCDRSIVYVGK